MSIGKYTYGRSEGLRGKQADDDDLNDRIQEEGDQTPVHDLESPLIQREVSEQSSDFETTQTGRKMQNFNFYDPTFESHIQNHLHENNKNIVDFLTHLAICHTVIIQKKTQKRLGATPK